MADKSHDVIWRMLHIPLPYKVIIANGVVITLMAVVGAVFAVQHMRGYPADPHFNVIALFAVTGLVISLVLNSLVMRLVLTPLERLQVALEDARQGRRCSQIDIGAISDERFDRLAATLAQLLSTLEQNAQQLHYLSCQILQAQEEERQRVARELHDEAAQTLTTVLIYLKLLEKFRDPEENQRVQNLLSLITHALEEVRQVALELRPKILDDWGLGAALGWRVDELNKDFSTKATLQTIGLESRLPKTLELVFYRVAQEALNNITRHAHARHVHVKLKREEDSVTLEVLDDGVGFDASAVQAGRSQGLGLLGMRERLSLVGGELSIESQPGKGTRLLASASLSHPALNGVRYEQDSCTAGR
jgi:two-component system sensor histidine kinase UhpB